MKFYGSLAAVIAAGGCTVAAVAAVGQRVTKAPAPVVKKSAPPTAIKKKTPPVASIPAPVKDAVSPEAAEFFETEVRPVLANNCYSCHGPGMQQAGFRADSLAALLKGTGDGHPALVAGDPDKSLLLQVVRYDGKVKMPPQGKLPQKSIDALTAWVKMGAPWPSAKGPGTKDEGQKSSAKAPHWSFLPVKNPAIPAVKNRAWVKSPLDALVLAKLEAKDLSPSPPADRRTLIRRAYFDLIGLPPKPEDVAAFLADKSPDAFAKVVDRLLASPHYGERWGRYWLDVARYADTKGYVFNEDRVYHNGYTYRDWVVDALNRDMPYDQFLTRQIAADLLPPDPDNKSLAAMGFLTLGRRFLNNTPDIIDDRIDVVMRGTQAMTVACARCHDHKFDPIPTKDYYSLYGVFASSVEPDDRPMLGDPAKAKAFRDYEGELGKRQGEVSKFRDAKVEEAKARAKAGIANSLLAAHDLARSDADGDAIASTYGQPKFLVNRWKGFIDGLDANHNVFGAWNRFSKLPADEFAAKAPDLAKEIAANADHRLSANVAKLFEGPPPAALKEVAERYAKLLSAPPEGDDILRHAVDSIGGPLNLNNDEAENLLAQADRDQLKAMRDKVEEFKKQAPPEPPRAMAMVDAPTPVTPHVFKRGNPGNPGDEVPRQFLAVLSGPNRKPFAKGSGRLELAQAITDKKNPLTARVMVNRVWLHHFGKPLVGTPSDFGMRSDPPTNPQLLDYLAYRFMQDGWSIKKLHRLIMLSAAYGQSSADNPKARKVDPENALLWRMNRQRLDFEAMRDTLLAVSGELDPAIGGPAVEITGAKPARRRTLYGFIDRQNLPGLFRTFDFASPDTTSAMRFQNTVPQQALFMMNSPFVIDNAAHLAERPEVAARKATTERIQALYRWAYGRSASPEEVALGLKFLQSSLTPDPKAAQEAPTWQYGYGEVNEATGRLKGFTPLPHFTGDAWQGGPDQPDPKTGWAMLTRGGGHPGNDPRHAVVRRWTAPRDGTYAVEGTLKHESDQGDGVRARAIASRTGMAGTWTAKNGRSETKLATVELKKGDTLDFVVDCRGSVEFDSFEWAPTVRLTGEAKSGPTEWNARDGFGGPKEATKTLDPWAKYAQVLLLSNEFIFVD